MNKSEPPGQTALLIEDHGAPEIYASQLLRCDLDMGAVIRLTFASNHADAASPTSYSQVVNLRLVMPPTAVENMLDFVGKWLANAKAVSAPIPPGASKH